MVVGVLRIRLAIPAAHSLKEKRRVVKRVVDKLQHRFHVSVAEVGDNDIHHRALIGVAVVANDGPFVNGILDKMLDATDSIIAGEADLSDHELELIHY